MNFTTRLGLNKPDPDPVTGDFVDVSKLNENADDIDAAISFTVCTSGARPASPFQGQAILETDTGKAYVWGGSAWLPLLIGNAVQIVTNLGIGVAPDAVGARRLRTFWGGTMGGTSQVLLEQSGAAAGSRALGIRAGGEANERYTVDFDGKMQWSPGTAGGDVTLGRSAAGTLDVGGTLTVGGVVPGAISRQIFTASGTWNKPAGAKSVFIQCVGGGGAGGGAPLAAAGQSTKGSGGGGGAYADRLMAASAITSPVTVTRGAGGTGVAGGNGNNGGTSSFGTYVGADGGVGGSSTAPSATPFGIAGGAGGSTGTGTPDLLAAGGAGGNGFGSGSLAVGGEGGPSHLGGGGAGTASAASGLSFAGNAGKNYGGGGGGALITTTGTPAQAGGAGAPGVVIVTTYF